MFGYSGDGGPAVSAQLRSPYGVSIDQTGRVFIADTTNNVIKMVNTDGIITTIAGTGVAGYSGDGGQSVSAQLRNPFGIYVDETGRVFLADTDDSIVRMVDANANRIITTIAGMPESPGYSEDGGPAISAQSNFPRGISIDQTGRVS
jgi:hypothetical protein